MSFSPRSLSGLHGRVSIVTGANHGIGAATARALADQGTDVVIAYLRLGAEFGTHPAADQRRSGAEEIVEAIQSSGGRAIAFEADLREASSCIDLFDAAESHFGPVEILVNNASGWSWGGADTFKAVKEDRLGRSLRRVTPSSIDQVFDVDARSAALLISEFARRHIKRGASWGRIVGLTSGGPGGFPEEVSYGAAKAALENFAMSAARELGDLGITSNIVYPPVTDTGWVTDKVRAAVATSREHLHVADPKDVAEVIAFLASEHGRMITGNVVHMR
ncbi:MAG: fabG 6 [Acidimicrobiaceae bacterium]|nr:fabG 6 [Acidimicrobiaceae bacterium]